MTRSHSRNLEAQQDEGPEADLTLKQGNKSRIVGLGWPDELTSPTWGNIADMTAGSPDQTQVEKNQSAAEGDLVLALTPENLPVLLEFLRQCEGKLGKWRSWVESAVPSDSVISAVAGEISGNMNVKLV